MSATYGDDGSPPSRGFPDETPPRLLPVLRLSRAARTGSRDMSDKPKSTFARRVRAARPRDKRLEVRDDAVQGLMLRIFPSGARTFALEGMVRGRRRYATLGNADSMTIPEARREARKLIASYIEPAKTGNGPRTPGHPMVAFAGEFLDRQARLWKPRPGTPTSASCATKSCPPSAA